MSDPRRRVARALAEGRLPSAKDRAWLVKQLDQSAAEADRAEKLRRRDEHLRVLAETCFPDLGVTQRAEKIAQLGRRYRTSGWQRDQRREEPPPERIGRPEEFLFRALKLGPIPKTRRLQDIVKAEECSAIDKPTNCRKSGV